MNKKLGIVMLSMVVALGGLAPVACAAEGDAGTTKKTAVKQPSRTPDSSRVTHSEVARMLVNLLALTRFLPANASVQETFAILYSEL